MLFKILRKKGVIKTCLWFIAIVIIIGFTLWGLPYRFGEKRTNLPRCAGEIFGQKISVDEFVDAYQAVKNQAIMKYGQQFQQYIQFINLEEEAWNRIILLKTAEKRNIRAANKEVIEQIKSFPFFKKNDKFDMETYNLLLNYVFRINPRKFEEQIRQSIITEKLAEEVLSKVDISETELQTAYSKENDTAKVMYILIEEELLKDSISVTEEKIADFYEKNKADFKRPQQVNVRYLQIDFDSQKEQVSIEEEEIKNYYLENKEQFKKELKENEDTDIDPYRPLEEVKAEIKDLLTTKKSQEKALELAYEVSDFLYEDKSFEEASKKFSLPINETGFFSSSEAIPNVGWSYQFLTTAFQLEKEQISDIIQTPKGCYIIKVIDKKEPFIPPLNEIKDSVREVLVKKEARKKAKEKAESTLLELRSKAKEENFDFSSAVENLGFKINTTDSFKRGDYIQNVGQSNEFTEQAFTLKEGEISGLIEVSKGFVILKTIEKQSFEQEKFKEEREVFKQRLLEMKKQQYYIEWFKDLKKKVRLKSNLSGLVDKK